MKNNEVLKPNFDGWPLPDSYLLELGRIAALWATLESFLNLCIGKLAGFNDLNDPKAFILVTHSISPSASTSCQRYVSSLFSSFQISKAMKVLSNNFGKHRSYATILCTTAWQTTLSPGMSRWQRELQEGR